MIPCLVILPDGRRGEVYVETKSTCKEIKEFILKEIGLSDSRDSYMISVYPKDETMIFENISRFGCTIKIEKRFKLKEETASDLELPLKPTLSGPVLSD